MKWEYLVGEVEIDRTDEETQSVLNGVGEHEWELVAIVPSQDSDGRRLCKVIFKRPISSLSSN